MGNMKSFDIIYEITSPEVSEITHGASMNVLAHNMPFADIGQLDFLGTLIMTYINYGSIHIVGNTESELNSIRNDFVNTLSYWLANQLNDILMEKKLAIPVTKKQFIEKGNSEEFWYDDVKIHQELFKLNEYIIGKNAHILYYVNLDNFTDIIKTNKVAFNRDYIYISKML
jgi:hypothetical protein